MYNGNPKPATPPSLGDNVTVKVMSNDVQNMDNRRSALRASLALQVKAMFIKNLHFQKRRKWANCCLCVLPVFFIVILVALQIIINRLLSASGNFSCPDDPSTATNAQKTWCAIAYPTAYPPLLKVSTEQRAPNAVIYTGANSDAIADKMTFSDAEISNELQMRWMYLKPMLYRSLNESCKIAPFMNETEFNSIMSSGCRITGDMKDPSGQSPAEFSATQWSQKAKGITSSTSPQIQAMALKLGSFPGGLDSFAECAQKGMSAFQNRELFQFAPFAEPKLAMSTFARLGTRKHPSFSVLL